jgi:Mg-chelatase subunit ChlD
VVDLTETVADPVEVLMKVQLGGGTDIAKAIAYGAQLIESPRRSIVVLITDFYEGGDASALERQVKALCEQGTTVLGLAALDEKANPIYDKELAQRLVQIGAHVGAMTPGELVGWIAEKVRV